MKRFGRKRIVSINVAQLADSGKSMRRIKCIFIWFKILSVESKFFIESMKNVVNNWEQKQFEIL